ncbi:MAG: CARDB domain-containing protein [candidate division KSB1 bacterium]|nr:CARDB domain-containing protein [candidate division KSB1 bacterium]
MDSISIDNYCANAGYTITATVKNIGYSDVGVTQTRFQVNGSTICSGVSTGIMTATNGQNPSRTVTCSVDCSSNPYACMSGTRTIMVTADVNGDVSEEDEGNNARSQDFTINKCPDFRIKKYGAAWNSGTVCKGQQQVYQYQVENVGDADGGYFYNRFYVDNTYEDQEFVAYIIGSSGGLWPSVPGTSCVSNGAMCWTPVKLAS